MKRSIKQLASIAAIGALALSASISLAAGEGSINTHSTESMANWYGNAGGPVPPFSLSTSNLRGGKVTTLDTDSLKDSYGRAGGRIGVSAATGTKGGKVASAAALRDAGCIAFGRAGSPVGADAIRCHIGEHSAVATSEAESR